MPRAVLDSSVLVSAFIKPRGAVAGLLRAPVRSRYRLCLSESILEETARKLLTKERLRRAYTYPDSAVREFIDVLRADAAIVGSLPELRVVPGDPKDDMVVATAVAARADWLVTGDRRHLLPLGSYAGTRIVTPRRFLELL
jgi:putative PIN family toxin of toxin-antitoxin system